MGLVVWIFKSGKTKKYPYIVSMIVSVVLIVVYIASRTIGVPIVGTEYYVGKLDILSKILQVIVIGLSCFAIYNMDRLSIVQRTNK